MNNARAVTQEGNKVQLTLGRDSLVEIQFSDSTEAREWRDTFEEIKTKSAVNVAFREFLTPLGAFFISLSFNKDEVSNCTKGLENQGIMTVEELATKDERFFSVCDYDFIYLCK